MPVPQIKCRSCCEPRCRCGSMIFHGVRRHVSASAVLGFKLDLLGDLLTELSGIVLSFLADIEYLAGYPQDAAT